MATNFIKNILHPNTANILTYLLLGEDCIDLSDFYYIKPIKEDIEECMEFLPADVIQKEVTDSKGFKISVINKVEFDKFLKNYINAYKEDNLNLKVNKNPPISISSTQKNESFYSYSENLFQMNEIFKDYKEGQIINLSSYEILREKSSLIRFAEIILDLYLNPPSKKEPYIEIIDCKKHYYPRNGLSIHIVLNIAMKLKKSPNKIYRELLLKHPIIGDKSKNLPSKIVTKSYKPKRKRLKLIYEPKDILHTKNVEIYLSGQMIILSRREYLLVYAIAVEHVFLSSTDKKNQVIKHRINEKIKDGLRDPNFQFLKTDYKEKKYVLSKYVSLK